MARFNRPWDGRTALLLGILAICTASMTASATAQQPSPSASPREPAEAAESQAAEVSRTPYQAELSGECFSNQRCEFYSNVVQANRRLEIHHISCKALHSEVNAAFESWAALAGAGTTDIFRKYLHDLDGSVQSSSQLSVYAVSQQIFLFIPANRRLRIRVASMSTGLSASFTRCQVSGYMVKLQPP